MRASTIAIALTCALVAQVATAQYASSTSSGDAFSRGSASSGGSRLSFTDVTLPELKGVWVNVGSQQPESVEIATENKTMPDCSMDNGMYSYSGLDTTAEQYVVLAGTASINRMVVNLQRSTFLPNVTLNGSLIVGLNRDTVSCNHFTPYVDLATGELMAESVSMTQWTINATSGAPARSNLNCQVTGNELPGCYTGQVSMTTASAPSVAISSITVPAPAPRPAGSIVTVSKNLYRCGNGECLRLAPKYASASPVYGG